jgi:hypothetical protein
MLDDLELPQVQEITALEQRVLAEHKPPAMDGSFLQNMGRRPSRLTLWGMASGPDAKGFVEKLDGKYRAGKPVPFIADIVADAEIEQMVVDDLRVQELAGKPQRYAYTLTLREYIEPVEPEDTSGLDVDIAGKAQQFMDSMIPGLDLGLDFATGLERFVAPLTDLLERLVQFNRDVERAGGGG